MKWKPVQLVRGPSESDIQQSVNDNLVKGVVLGFAFFDYS